MWHHPGKSSQQGNQPFMRRRKNQRKAQVHSNATEAGVERKRSPRKKGNNFTEKRSGLQKKPRRGSPSTHVTRGKKSGKDDKIG